MRKYTIQEVKEKCAELGGECLSEEYISVKDKLKLKCPKCSNIYYRNFENILVRKTVTCPLCSKKIGGKKQSFSFDYVKKYIEEESNSSCILLSEEYTGIDNKINIKCKCGNKFKTTFYKFKNRDKKQCNDCGKLITKNKLLIKESEIIKIIESNGYTYIKNNTDSKDQRVFIQCDNKHLPYWVRLMKFKRGQRCPNCQRSLGEEFVSSELDKHSINYKSQQTFDKLVGIGGKLLRYDFAIIERDKILGLIEYDGKQHFEVAFDSYESFEKTKIHDNLKNEYAKLNNIPLYRIPYTQYDNIPQIINKIINNLSKCLVIN